LLKILAIKALMNRGLSDELKSAFPDLVPAIKPLLKNPQIYKGWMHGFVCGEGSFFVEIFKSKTVLGFQVRLVFKVSQHSRDEQLLKSFIKYFDCGKIYKQSSSSEVLDFVVKKFIDIEQKIIPFFIKHPLYGVKSKDFEDFCKIANIIKEAKPHLNPEGLEQIRQIKEGMNKGRKFN
jgi:hypothetical protein